MKIFIQKSNRSIRYSSIFFQFNLPPRSFLDISSKIFFPEKFPKKLPPKEPSHQRSNFQDPASKFPRKLRSWKLPIPAGEGKNQKGLEKSFVRFGNSIGAFSSANFFASQRLSRSSICKTTTSKHLLHAKRGNT